MPTVRLPFRSALRIFARARTGNVAITFAFAIIPILAFVGAAVDYTHANAVRASMQSALDATGLMMSKQASSLSDVSENGQPSDLDSKARSIFTRFVQPQRRHQRSGQCYLFDDRWHQRRAESHGQRADHVPLGHRLQQHRDGQLLDRQMGLGDDCASRWCSTIPAR